MSRITKYLGQTVQWEAQSGAEDENAQPVFLPAVSLPGRKEDCFKVMVDQEGFQAIASARVFLEPSAKVRARDRIDGFVVHSLNAQQGRAGIDHVVAYLGGG